MKRLMMKTIIDYQNDEREKVLLDVRDKQEFEKETYPGARNWYWEELIKVLEETPEEFTQQFDKSVPIYLLCYTGLHSDDLADILEEMGYEVYSLYGGWGAYMKWKFENYVKEAQAENELSGEERVKEIERRSSESLYGESSHRHLMNTTLYRMEIRLQSVYQAVRTQCLWRSFFRSLRGMERIILNLYSWL